MFDPFESMDTSSGPPSPASWPSGLSRRHRRLSSSSQSLRELIDAENVIENITPSHCDLYLITRKKLSQINTNAFTKQSPDLRREVLLTSIHRTITSKSSPVANGSAADSEPLMTTGHKSTTTDCPPIATSNSVQQQYKYTSSLMSSMSCHTSTSTTTMATSSSSTRLISTSSTTTTSSAIKKRNLSPNSLPNSDFEEDWKTTIKRVKVGHGFDAHSLDVSMDSELDSGYCDNDLNDLTNNFHSLKTPFT